jgi:flagellar transcriptional activator FlhD
MQPSNKTSLWLTGGMNMNAKQIHEEIKETNLSFLLLTQKMIRNDKATAISSLGVSEEMAGLVAGLSPAQLLKMSATNMMMCSFHFDESLLLDMVSGYSKDRLVSNTPATIRKVSRVEALAA